MSTCRPSSSATRYVLAISAGSVESLNTCARELADFLSGDPQSGRRAFTRNATLPGVAATLLNFRECAPHRLGFSADTVAEAADKLSIFAEHTGQPKLLAPQGLYANVVHWSAFDEDPDGQDRNYILALAASGRHNQLAKLWSVGFSVDWQHVYPELLAERPVYLPPTPLHRRRYWPKTQFDSQREEAAATTWSARESADATIPRMTAPPDTDAPEQVRPVGLEHRRNGSPQLVAELTELPTTLRVRRLCGYLQDHIADLLDYPEGELPHIDSGFFDLGMSSIHLAQLRQFIIVDTTFEPSETSAFDYPNIAELAAYLARELAGYSKEGAAPPAFVVQEVAPAATEPPRSASMLHSLDQDDIDRLSARDLERALTEVLS